MNSIIFDSSNIPMSEATDKGSVIYGRLNTEYIKDIRKRFSLFEQRRPELHELFSNMSPEKHLYVIRGV